jgi:hypothetical protein
VRIDDLAAIRRLSQYRPFERGGASALEAKQDLVLAALAEAGGSCEAINECRESIKTLWGIDLDDLEIAQAVQGLIDSELIFRDDGVLTLSAFEKERLDAHAELSRATARLALDDWHETVTDRFPSLTSRELESLDSDLQAFLARVVHRHGAEAALLMYPDDEGAQRLYQQLEDEGFDFLGQADRETKERREWAVAQFIRRPTDAQKAFLSAVLNVAYYTTVLTIDPAAARLIHEEAKGQRVYLDTNFIYRLMGVQGPRFIRPAETILRVTQAAGYVCAVTPWTIAEYRFSLERSRKFLIRYPLPPDDFASLAAEATSDEDFVTSFWRQTRNVRLTIEDYVAYHSEVEAHLAGKGIALTTEGVKAVAQQEDEINSEVSIMERVLHGKFRHHELLVHDVKHRLLIRRLRGTSNRTFASAGYWFLTHDTVLPRYDYRATERDGSLPFCVSASAWFQVVEAFRPKTEDLEQTLTDILASPYIRPHRTISKQAAQAVVARIALYKDGTPALAARVFMNSAAMSEIEKAGSPEEQEGEIEKAIITAAKEAQEAAKEAQAAAAAERARAEQSADEARQRVQEAEARQKAELERAQATSAEALKNEEARAAEAVRLEQERAERALADERERHGRELREARDERDRADTAAARFRRRLILFARVVVATIVFSLIGLVAGVEQAWAYVVGFGALLGIAAAVDQLFARRGPQQ